VYNNAKAGLEFFCNFLANILFTRQLTAVCVFKKYIKKIKNIENCNAAKTLRAKITFSPG
jgi:hypothetical protein